MTISTLPLAIEFAALGLVAPKADENGEQKQDTDGNDLYTVNAVITDARGKFEGINVTVPVDEKGRVPGAGMTPLTQIRFQGLEAGYYTSARGDGWWFKAKSFAPAPASAAIPTPRTQS